MQISQEASRVVEDPTKYLTTIHGLAGIGKTSFGAQIPGHYFMITEAGVEGVEVFGDPVLSWEEFWKRASLIADQKERGWKDEEDKPVREVKVIVIDTYEVLYGLCAKWVCKTQTFPEKGVHRKYDRIEDVPYGKGYSRTNEFLIGTLNKIKLLGFGILCICHTKGRTIKWRGQDIEHYAPNLPPTGINGVVDASGAVGYFYMDERTEKDEEGRITTAEEHRFQIWQPSFQVTAKHRLREFPAKLPLEIDKGYETYMKAFEETVSKKRKNSESI